MHLTKLIAASHLLAVAQAVTPPYEQCDSYSPPEEALEAARHLQEGEHLSQSQSASQRRSRSEGLIIPTYLHVVESEELAGFVTDKMLNDQVC